MTLVELSDILPAATIMVVSVAASTTSGKVLDSTQLSRVMDACKMTLQLEEARSKLLAFVESRMNFIAPNLSALVGSAVAARLIAAAGGLKALAKIPACNVMLLGAPKRQLGGFSSAHSRRCMNGYIHESDIIKKTPPAHQLRALRLISNKIVLAIRMDAEHSHPDGEEGRKLYDVILKKLEKLQEPPPPKLAKPLPAPDDKPKKRRGGARARRNKEKYAVTDLRKHANRMSFGVAEEETASTGRGLGMAGSSGSGKIRLSAQEKNLLKKQKQQQAGLATPGFATSGLASSLAFTPVLGLELVNPNAAAAKAEEIKALNNKYFSQGNFFQVKKQKTDQGQ
jgi:U4/U6 small nuclear ribonucleoprotein PRP31